MGWSATGHKVMTPAAWIMDAKYICIPCKKLELRQSVVPHRIWFVALLTMAMQVGFALTAIQP
jgi:uncharacterized membrane protein AbrB (regulator of aidB expression)